jgi:S1-C subfamily serine protease
MRSSIVSINGADPTHPVGSGVIVRGGEDDDAIVATALHVVGEIAADDLQIGFAVPPSTSVRGGVTVLGATVIATDEANDLALLRMEHDRFLRDGVPHQSGGTFPATVAELEPTRPDDGEGVMISGFPLGYRYLLNSAGIIACAWGDQCSHRPDDAADDSAAAAPRVDRYLVDINVNPGNSGGPCYRISDQRVLGICEALQLVEVAIPDHDPGVEGASDRPGAAGLDVDEEQRGALQKADITFVVPAPYVIALLDGV